jgi:DNA repair exonuclease SbcCD ATPase subunit
MPDILETFKQKAADLTSAIDRAGGIRATIEGLRRQMAEADRRRAMNLVKSELKRLNAQITEMITAIGIQAVGLEEAGKLGAPELQALCRHVIELKQAVAQQEAELAKMEAEAAAAASKAGTAPASAAAGERMCPSCGRVAPAAGSFCPYCGATLPEIKQFCSDCGSELRPGAKFCAKCGQPVNPPIG